MKNTADQSKFIPDKKRTSMYKFHFRTFVYGLVSILTIPFGFLFVVCTIPFHIHALRYAASIEEKKYRYFNVVGHLLITYTVIVLFLLVVNEFRAQPSVLLNMLPSFSALWCKSLHKIFLVLMDAVLIFALGLGAICAARYFGYVDEAGTWCSRTPSAKI